jgi:hypothetical protein
VAQAACLHQYHIIFSVCHAFQKLSSVWVVWIKLMVTKSRKKLGGEETGRSILGWGSTRSILNNIGETLVWCTMRSFFPHRIQGWFRRQTLSISWLLRQ